jgi:hypothetical protein
MQYYVTGIQVCNTSGGTGRMIHVVAPAFSDPTTGRVIRFEMNSKETLCGKGADFLDGEVALEGLTVDTLCSHCWKAGDNLAGQVPVWKSCWDPFVELLQATRTETA